MINLDIVMANKIFISGILSVSFPVRNTKKCSCAHTSFCSEIRPPTQSLVNMSSLRSDTASLTGRKPFLHEFYPMQEWYFHVLSLFSARLLVKIGWQKQYKQLLSNNL